MAVKAGNADWNGVSSEAIEKGDLLAITGEGIVSKTVNAASIGVGVADSWAEGAGEAVAVQSHGAVAVRASGTVNAANLCSAAANGRVAANGGATEIAVGIALTGAADGEWFTMIFLGQTQPQT